MEDFNTYLNLANSYYNLSEYEKAYYYNKKCLYTFKLIKNADSIRKASIYNNIGNTLVDLGKYDSAIYYLNKSIDIFTANYGDTHYSVGRGITNIGLAYQKNNNIAKAYLLYNQSLGILVGFSGNKDKEVAKCYNYLAQISQLKSAHFEALSFANKSLQSNLISHEKDSTFSNLRIINNFRDYSLLLDALYIKGSSQEKIQENTQQKKYLVESYNTYNLGCKIIDSLKSTFTTSADKIELLNVSKNLFDGAIRTKLMLSKLNDDKPLNQHLLQVIQNYKSTLLSDNSEVNESLSDSLKTEIPKIRKH